MQTRPWSLILIAAFALACGSPQEKGAVAESAASSDSGAPSNAQRDTPAQGAPKDALDYMGSALEKYGKKDGKGCLADLDMHDKLERSPSDRSTWSGGMHSRVRAGCLMLVGRCDEGKTLLRAFMKAGEMPGVDPKNLDDINEKIRTEAEMACPH